MKTEGGSARSLCPRCGGLGFEFGGDENAGLQIDGVDVSWGDVGEGVVHHDEKDCRRWGGGSCMHCKLRLWEDMGADPWHTYCQARPDELKPEFCGKILAAEKETA